MPRRVILPEIIPVRQSSEAELAAAARAASAMQAARRLADWFGGRACRPGNRVGGARGPIAGSGSARLGGAWRPGDPGSGPGAPLGL